MILLDTNILIYAINQNSNKMVTARNFINENIGKLIVSDQNINEALRVLTHEKFENFLSIKQARKAVLRITDNCTRIFPNSSTHKKFLRILLRKNVVSNHIYDAYLIATMLSNGINQLATDNEKDFEGYKDIKIKNPFA